MEKITVTGNVGKDPELRDIKGKQYTSFSVGVWAGKDQPTNWYGCLVYGDQTSRIVKGNRVLVCGNPKIRVWKEAIQRDIFADFWENLSPREKAADVDVEFP